MTAPETMSERKARKWLSEALGDLLPKGSKVCYEKPYIHFWEPRYPGMVELYDVSNIYGECEDEISIKDSPLKDKI